MTQQVFLTRNHDSSGRTRPSNVVTRAEFDPHNRDSTRNKQRMTTPKLAALRPRGPNGKVKKSTYVTPPPEESASAASPIERGSSSSDVDELLRTETPSDETTEASDFSLPSSLLSSPALHTAQLSPQRPSPLGLSHGNQSNTNAGVQWPTLPVITQNPPAPANQQSRLMAAVATVEPFGGRRDQNPKKFLRDLKYQMTLGGITTPEAKADFFLLRVEADSLAEEWYLALPQQTRESWDLLEPQFETRWATQQPMTRTDTEKTYDLLNHKLKPEDVGTTVQYQGRAQHAHVAWAEDALDKARACGIENRTEYIPLVIADLPDSVRKSMARNYSRGQPKPTNRLSGQEVNGLMRFFRN
jgi:hypothetical protein